MPSSKNPAQDVILAQRYASDFSIPLELAEILAWRFPDYNNAELFLFPDVKQLYAPETIPDMELATNEIINALNNNEGILIYCHDDPDGYTSAAIMYKTLKDLRKSREEAIFIYPIVREKDGYILNPAVLREYKQQGVKLMITVDFGISSPENFRVAQNEGLKLVVCDHHETDLTEFSVPAVDPKRPDSRYAFRELAGVGVTFKLAQNLYKKVLKLSPDEFYSLKKEFFPLAMIGTISDRVILRGENRVFCHHGLQLFNSIDEPWIQYFREDRECDISHITKDVIPVIGSAAYCDPNYGPGIMINSDYEYVAESIRKLRAANIERRQGVELLFKEAISAAKIYPKLVISIITFPRQHYLGAVSARCKDRYKRTSAVIGIKDDKCFGELRSNNINLYKMLSNFQNLFFDFGGHCKAAGFTMPQKNLDVFVDGMVSYISKVSEFIRNGNQKTNIEPAVFLHKSNIDILMPLAPFGEGNPAPVLTDGTSIYTIDHKFNIIDKGI